MKTKWAQEPYYRPLREIHPSTDEVLQFFDYRHLPGGPGISPRALSQEIATAAHLMVSSLPDSPELTAGLRKLLEAKDCFVRALIAHQSADGQ